MELSLSQLNNPNILVGSTGVVHIRGRNDMIMNQQLGIHIIVEDPDGHTVEDYGPDWASGKTDPYDTHHFISPPFELYKEGIYTLDAKLLMNKDNPVTVDSYKGALCTVVAEVPPVPLTCVIDADCPEGYVCKDGICVPEEKFPWLPVILIGSGVVVASYLLVRRKK